MVGLVAVVVALPRVSVLVSVATDVSLTVRVAGVLIVPVAVLSAVVVVALVEGGGWVAVAGFLVAVVAQVDEGLFVRLCVCVFVLFCFAYP